MKTEVKYQKIAIYRYVRITSPLKSVVTGDYYVKHQTLNQAAWGSDHFVEATYEAQEKKAVGEGETYVNRSVNGTYYSMYSSDYQICDPYNTFSVDKIVNQWAAPVNGLFYEIKPATSFDVWVSNGAMTTDGESVQNAPMTFHFPSSNTTYDYYATDGNLSMRAADNITRKASGLFAFGDNHEDELTVELTHTGKASMFAVGNPAFAYMDIARFIDGNNEHISPYVYTHVEQLGTRGHENIYYYDYTQSPYKLYCLSTNYDNAAATADGSNETVEAKPSVVGKEVIEKTNRQAYINPAEGFRVIGGSVAFVCDEPDLVGVYNNATFRIADAVRSKYYNLSSDGTAGTRIDKANGGTNSDIPLLKAKTTTFTYAISTTENPAYVRLNNFLNRGSVLAKIVPTEKGKSGQLVIEDGQNIMAVFQGNLVTLNSNGNYVAQTSTTWSTDYADYWDYTHLADYDVRNENLSVTTYKTPTSNGSYSNYTNGQILTRTGFIEAYRTMKLHGLYADWSLSTQSYEVGCEFASYQTSMPGILAYRITNTNTSNITLNYTIENGTVNIWMPDGTKMFIESDAARLNETKPAFNTIMRTNGSSDNGVKGYQCESWYAYEGFASSKVNDNSSTDFIMPEMVGDYSTAARVNLGNTANGYNCYDQYLYVNSSANSYVTGLSINRVLGSNNTVMIKGLYPGDQDANVLGQISVTAAGSKTATAQYSAFTTSNGYKATVSGSPITIAFTGAGSGSDYRSIPNNGSIKVSGAKITKVVISTKNGYKGTWSTTSGGSVSDRTWTGEATSVVLNQGNSTAARVTKIVVTYEGYDYTLIIPAGQLAQITTDANGKIDPAKSHYFYAHGNQEDMVKTLNLKWTYDTTYGGVGYWRNTSAADNNACWETMVARQGIQPLVENEYFDGLVYGQYHYTDDGKKNYFELYQTKKGDVNKAPEVDVKPGQVAVLKLTFDEPMFVANPQLTSAASSAPRRVAANTNAPMAVTATSGNVVASTMVVVSPSASNEFNRLEDAPLFGAGSAAFSFGTIAGTQLVGVNAIASLDTLPLFLSCTATLQFANISSLADQVYLYDAVEETATVIVDGTDYLLEINDGEQAGRYFLVAGAEVPSITTDVENMAPGFGWKPVAYCPQTGALAVSCAEPLHYELYSISGMLLGSADAQSYTFNGLQAGTYVVRATRGNEMQALKVIVY